MEIEGDESQCRNVGAVWVIIAMEAGMSVPYAPGFRDYEMGVIWLFTFWQ